jgi:hypothetical protein
MAFFAPLPHRGTEVEGLAAKGTLQVFLDQVEAPERKAGVVGWIEERVGEPGKEVDSMTAVDFLTSASRFLELTGAESVYDVWFDHNVVFRVSKEREDEDNHKEALSSAIESSKGSNAHMKEIGIWSHGVSGDFYLELRLRFRRMHDVGSPAMILEVGGNPSELTDPGGESQFELDDRLTSLEGSKDDVEKENAQIKPKFEAKLNELEDDLRQAFKVKYIKHDSTIDVGSIW